MLTFSDPGFTKSAWSPQPSQTTQGNIPLQIPAHLSAPPPPPPPRRPPEGVSLNPPQTQKKKKKKSFFKFS